MNNIENTLESCIKFKFPNIMGLTVDLLENRLISIGFQEGEYTKQEVETYLEFLKEETKKPVDLSYLKNMKIEETFYGVRIVPNGS